MGIPNKVQLITYADSLGGDLCALRETLDRYFPSLFPVLHILPPFTSSGDRGFAPISYTEIEPSFGTWDDIDRLGKQYNLLMDIMVNHISAKSFQFQDFLQFGRKSIYADFFLTLDKLWPKGIPNQDDLNKVYLRRPCPYSEYRTMTGVTENVWTTFGMENPSEQVDLDINCPDVLQMFKDIFSFLSKHGVGIVRLDAVGYVIKKMGTSCFLAEPEFSQFLSQIKETADTFNIDLLCEIHADREILKKIAQNGYWIYDFLLPYAILETLLLCSNELLYQVIKERPHNQFTTLDCHDGVPVIPDLDGIFDFDKVKNVCRICEERGAHFTRIVSENHKSMDGFDVHQICGSYYSMLKSDDAYIAARAIQFFIPGIPQLYYVGLLAGENDEERRLRTGDDREANRHNYTSDEIAAAVEKEVVQRLCRLIRLRNTHGAFNGIFSVSESNNKQIDFQWIKDSEFCRLKIDLVTMRGNISYSENNEHKQINI